MNVKNPSVSTIVCPACGFTFKPSKTDLQRDQIKCPQCGHVISSTEFPQSFKDFKRKTI